MQQKNSGRPTNPDPDIGWGGHGTGRKGGIALAPIVAKAAASRLRRESQLGTARSIRRGVAMGLGSIESPGSGLGSSLCLQHGQALCNDELGSRRRHAETRLPRGVAGVRPLVRELRRRTFRARPRFADRLRMTAHVWTASRPQNARHKTMPDLGQFQ